MVSRVHLRIVNRLLLPAMIFALAAASSFGATYNLRAAATPVTMPDGTVVTMWGYALVSYNIGAGTVLGDNVPKVPGPTLTVPPGQTLLTVNLTNNLPPGNDTSIVIPGLRGALTPVKSADAQGRQRIRSFTAVTPVGATVAYNFNGIKPGTYLYHSGTHAQVQVQMGLYGAVAINTTNLVPGVTPGQAYPGKTFLNEAILFYSEIDPDLHAAVESNDYGPGKAVTSTLNYKPKYFLINGQPFPGQTAPPTAKPIDLNEPMLLRQDIRRPLDPGRGGQVPALRPRSRPDQRDPARRRHADVPDRRTGGRSARGGCGYLCRNRGHGSERARARRSWERYRSGSRGPRPVDCGSGQRRRQRGSDA